MLRLFIAIELPKQVTDALAQVQRQLGGHPGSRHVRWTSPASTHLTLRFLGDTREDAVSGVERCLVDACLSCPPLTLTLAGLGAFPDRRRPRVIWVGLEEGEDASRLASLQGALESCVARLGYAPEVRAFSPHLTLGRVRRGLRPAEVQEVSAMLDRGAQVPPVSFTVPNVSLMRSSLRPEGAVYTRVAQGRLAGS